jgi:hypothetical protein
MDFPYDFFKTELLRFGFDKNHWGGLICCLLTCRVVDRFS